MRKAPFRRSRVIDMLNYRTDPVQDYSLNKKRVGRESRSNKVMEEDCERAIPCLGEDQALGQLQQWKQ